MAEILYITSIKIHRGSRQENVWIRILFSQILQISAKISNFYEKTGKNLLEEPDEFPGFASPL